MTGVLDRLERGGWVVRDRDPNARRGVLIRALRDRNVPCHNAGQTAADELASQ